MFDDVRVLDLSHLLPGQFATALLAQLGADVVTVEPADQGDYLRQYPASYAAFNHSKRSVAIDLKDDDGLAAFRSLAEKADVVVEEFRPGVATKLGVDYDATREVNPEIVYCSISGHGQDGPRADHVGHDLNYVGIAGILDVAPKRDGIPLYPPVLVADMSTAMFAALSIGAAVYGEGGEYIDVAMTDAAVNTMSVHLAEAAGRGSSIGWGDTAMLGGYPANHVYKCADDEFLTVGAIEPHFWKELCQKLELGVFLEEQWAGDPQRREEIFAAFRERFRERTRAGWLATFDQTAVPVEPVNSIEELASDEQLSHRGAIRDVEFDGSDYPITSFPARFDRHTVSHDSPPGHGEHTREVLQDAGFDPSDIDSLAALGTITETDTES